MSPQVAAADGRRHIYWKSGGNLGSSDSPSDESLLREAIIKETDRPRRDFSQTRPDKVIQAFYAFLYTMSKDGDWRDEIRTVTGCLLGR